MKFLDNAPRFLFFTGKGGVGKTSLACATAMQLAALGQRVLLVSTDPASNVGQVFGLAIGNQVTAVPEVPRLWALEIDPQAAAQGYRDRIVGPVRGVLPDDVVKGIEEQLSGACTTEIAAFDEFTALLTDASLDARYEHIIFDTAPTGHTIRLLQLPGAWSGFLESGKGDASCLGPLAGLEKQRSQYQAAVAALADGTRTRLVLVARAQQSTLREAARTHGELHAIGLGQQYLVINGVFPPSEAAQDPLAAAICRREQAVLRAMPPALQLLPTDLVALKPFNLVGRDALRQLLVETQAAPVSGDSGNSGNGSEQPDIDLPRLAALVDGIAADGHGLVMLMGKGGVGKTTLAAAVAVELAHRGFAVHLSTSDPAANLEQTLGGALENLTVSRIDPHEVTERYRQQVLASKGAKLDAAGRALLEEDLRSPCTEEIAVFPGLLAHHPRSRQEVCCDGHGPHRPHAAAAGRHGRLPPRHRAPDGQHGRALHHADDAAPGPQADQGDSGHAGRNHAGAGSRQPAERPAPRRHRALGLGHQQQRGGRPGDLAAAAPARPQRTARDRCRDHAARHALGHRAAAERGARGHCAPAGACRVSISSPSGWSLKWVCLNVT